MVPDASTAVEAPSTNESSSAVVNGLVGGIAGVLLSFVPLSTLLGGVVAGYLEGGTPERGLKAGAVAGLVMLVPFVLLFSFLLFLLGFGAPRAFGVMVLPVLLGGALYTVGLGVLGGYLGVYLEREF